MSSVDKITDEWLDKLVADISALRERAENLRKQLAEIGIGDDLDKPAEPAFTVTYGEWRKYAASGSDYVHIPKPDLGLKP
jgi:hypothetical protein